MAVTTERYEAVVSAIEGFDDEYEKRGVIKVICPALMADDETPLPVLCEPAHDWGWFYVPDVGEAVEIEVVTSSDRDETWGQQTLEALAPTWRGKRQHTDVETEGDDPRPIHVDYTDTNYGKRRGFSTPFGHVLLFDDTEGKQRIYLTHAAEQLEPGATPDPEKYTRIEIEPDGSLKTLFLNKHLLHFTTERGNVLIGLDGEGDADHKHTIEFDAEQPKVEALLAEGKAGILLDSTTLSIQAQVGSGDHAITIDGNTPSLEVKLGGDNALLIDQTGADAVATFGDGAVHAAIAEHLEEYLNDTMISETASMHDEHDHYLPEYIPPLIPVPGAPIPCTLGTTPGVGIPIEPASLTDYDTSITSSHLEFPDG